MILSKDPDPMSISSVSPSPAVQPPAKIITEAPPPPPSDATNDDDSNDAGAAQIVTAAPLPPGQGTRIDQLV
jgi:hypothetical protein